MNKYIELFKNHKKYSLYNKQIDDNDVLLICEALSKNEMLKELNLRINYISDKGAKALAKNTTLEKLSLYGNKISDEGAKALAKNKTLKELSLRDNKIFNEGAKALAKNTTLIKLNLGRNWISDELLLKQIFINIENNNKRQKLSILTTKNIEKNNIEIPSYYPKILLKY